MALSKITYPAKNIGDLWRHNEANEIKQVVNDLVDAVEDISVIPQVFLTQQAYDALVSAGTVDPNTIYNIYESV